MDHPYPVSGRDGHPPRGVAYFWRKILGFFGGLYRKFTNEASLIEKSETCDGIAAGWAVR